MPALNKTTRYLKVVRSFSHKPKAALPLSGKWLEQAGFKIGTYVEIKVQKKCLVITPDVRNQAFKLNNSR